MMWVKNDEHEEEEEEEEEEAGGLRAPEFRREIFPRALRARGLFFI